MNTVNVWCRSAAITGRQELPCALRDLEGKLAIDPQLTMFGQDYATVTGIVALSETAGIDSRTQILTAIRRGAGASGVDFSYLLEVAQKESGLRPEVKASTSSATGTFQFIDDTWLRVVARYGERHGLSDEANAIEMQSGRPVVADKVTRAEILALRKDPELSARMAGELTAENARQLEGRLGRVPTQAELYAAHVFGPSRASQLIAAAEATPGAIAANFATKEAVVNPGLFYARDSGAAVTLAGLFDRLEFAGPVNDVAAGPSPAVIAHSDTSAANVPRAAIEVASSSLGEIVQPGPIGAEFGRSSAMWEALLDLQSAEHSIRLAAIAEPKSRLRSTQDPAEDLTSAPLTRRQGDYSDAG